MAELKDFSSLISGLHSNATLVDEVDTSGYIEINSKRQFIESENFDTIIAYEGDINSQIITFKCIRYHDMHDLSACAHKIIKWKNLTSGAEGKSDLTLKEISEQTFTMEWEVPSDVCTSAGILEISVSLYDTNEKYIVFSWNTASYNRLTIGGSMEKVGINLPAKDEILVIDKDTKNIIAPPGYNNIVGYYGELGVNEVYFLVNRYIGKKNEIDVLDEKTYIRIYVTMAGYMGSDGSEREGSEFSRQLYTEEIDNRNKEGLVLLTWKLPAGITNGVGKATNFEITVSFYRKDGNVETSRWFSNIYPNLRIGNSVLSIPISPGSAENWDLFEDIVAEAINEYFNNPNNNFVIDANPEQIIEEPTE